MRDHLIDTSLQLLNKRGLWGCNVLTIETYRPEQHHPVIEQNILEQAAGLLHIQNFSQIAPYVPCHDLVISIDQLPEEAWMLPFFTKMAANSESNQIYSLTLTNP